MSENSTATLRTEYKLLGADCCFCNRETKATRSEAKLRTV